MERRKDNECSLCLTSFFGDSNGNGTSHCVDERPAAPLCAGKPHHLAIYEVPEFRVSTLRRVIGLLKADVGPNNAAQGEYVKYLTPLPQAKFYLLTFNFRSQSIYNSIVWLLSQLKHDILPSTIF